MRATGIATVIAGDLHALVHRLDVPPLRVAYLDFCCTLGVIITSGCIPATMARMATRAPSLLAVTFSTRNSRAEAADLQSIVYLNARLHGLAAECVHEDKYRGMHHFMYMIEPKTAPLSVKVRGLVLKAVRDAKAAASKDEDEDEDDGIEVVGTDTETDEKAGVGAGTRSKRAKGKLSRPAKGHASTRIDDDSSWTYAEICKARKRGAKWDYLIAWDNGTRTWEEERCFVDGVDTYASGRCAELRASSSTSGATSGSGSGSGSGARIGTKRRRIGAA